MIIREEGLFDSGGGGGGGGLKRGLKLINKNTMEVIAMIY